MKVSLRMYSKQVENVGLVALVGTLCFGMLFPCSALADSQIIDEIVLSINEKPHTRQELGFGRTDSKRVQSWIAKQLLTLESESLGVGVGADEIDRYMQELRRQNNLSESQFETLLEQKGLTQEAYRREVESEIVKTRVFGSRVRSRVQVTDEDIEKFYLDRPEALPEKGSYHLVRIQSSCSPSGSCAEAEKKLASLKKTIQSKATTSGSKIDVFNLVQASKSSGFKVTDFGFVSSNEMRQELLELVEDLDPQEFSEVVRGPEALEMSYLADVFRGVDEGLPDSLRERARREIFEDKFEIAVEKYLSQELQAKYFVDQK